MALEIREATAQDAPALAELSLVVHALHVAWKPDVFRTPVIQEMQRRCVECLAQEDFRAYLALRDGRPIGCIAVRQVERPGHILMHSRRFLDIESICVLPEERGKGIGKALLEKAKEFAREHGISRIELNVWKENAEAQRAFAAWGFQTRSSRMSLELPPPVEGGREARDIPTEKVRPTLETVRLILRPFAISDAADVQRLAGERAVASTTLSIPHPYEDAMAEAWIGTHQEAFEKGTGVNFAVVLKESGALIGAIGMGVNREHQHAEIGYWIGVPFWNHGYCTEAARAVLQYGFEALALERIFGHHFTRNPASGRVMQKLGMTHEGCSRRHIKKWEVFENVEVYGIVKSEWGQGSTP
jgi:RimJ/RimL family protein N-acetyltransferase